MLRRLTIAAALIGPSSLPAVAWAGPEEAEPEAPSVDDGEGEDGEGDGEVDALQKDPVDAPPVVEVKPLAKARHNLYAGFSVFGGATNYDTLDPIEVAGALGLSFRMGGRIVDAFALGGQLHAIFALARQSGSSGTILLEASVFPLKKRNHTGLAFHLGVGAISFTRREPDVNEGLIDFTQGRFVTTGGLATMVGIGWDFWLQNNFNFGIHGRFDAGFTERPQAPTPDPGTRPLLWVPSLELALNWY